MKVEVSEAVTGKILWVGEANTVIPQTPVFWIRKWGDTVAIRLQNNKQYDFMVDRDGDLWIREKH